MAPASQHENDHHELCSLLAVVDSLLLRYFVWNSGAFEIYFLP